MNDNSSERGFNPIVSGVFVPIAKEFLLMIREKTFAPISMKRRMDFSTNLAYVNL